MIDIKHKRCIFDNCNKRPSFNNPIETKGLYCFDHKLENMIDIYKKTCIHNKCKNASLYGLPNKKPTHCNDHKQPNMINLILESKCATQECNNEYEFIIDNIKCCLEHSPKEYLINIKKLCKYCDMEETSKYVCKECKEHSNKKEWAIIRHLRKNIDTKFEHNSSSMLQGCSKKRPDVFFELEKHCVIVEIDEHQHKTYDDSCECSRINEIVNGIGGRSVIIIRFNPDIIKNKKKNIVIPMKDRLNTLINTIKNELIKQYDTFIVKLIQLYYNDNCNIYVPIKEEDITKTVCI